MLEDLLQRCDNFVVCVEVDAIVLEFHPTEPCLEPPAIQFIDRAEDLANRGMINELEKLGEVYVRRTA